MTNLSSSPSSTNSFVQEAKSLLSKIPKTSKNKGYAWKTDPETVSKIIECWSKSELALWEFAKELNVAESVLRRFTHGCTSTSINHRWPDLIACFEQLGLSFPNSKGHIIKSATVVPRSHGELSLSVNDNDVIKVDNDIDAAVVANLVANSKPVEAKKESKSSSKVKSKKKKKIVKKHKPAEKNKKSTSKIISKSYKITPRGEILVTTVITTTVTKVLKRNSTEFDTIQSKLNIE